jgi:phosphopantothenoylcysteine synthetase/decarboxylase
MSTGRYGAELATSFRESNILLINEEINFLHAKHSILPSAPLIIRHEFDDYFDYVQKARSLAPKMNIIISAAAVSDYIVAPVEGKISSDQDEIIIKLHKADKVLPALRAINPNATIVGFKLLVDPSYQEINNAVQKVLNNGADYVVFNDLNRIKKGDNTRLIFNKKMNFREMKTTDELTNYILDEHFTRSNR